MERFALEMYPWFERITFSFEKVKPGTVAEYCDGHVIVDSEDQYHHDVYVEPGFHAVGSVDYEYGQFYVAPYQPCIGAISEVYPLDESTPREWELAKQLLAGKIQYIPTEQEREDEEDRFVLETEGRLTGVRYHL